VDQAEAGPAGLESIGGCLAAVGGAVVDHPEHAACRGVGLGGHDLVDEPGAAAREEIERLRATVTEHAVVLHLQQGKSVWD
jgi:hypothetical protein